MVGISHHRPEYKLLKRCHQPTVLRFYDPFYIWALWSQRLVQTFVNYLLINVLDSYFLYLLCVISSLKYVSDGDDKKQDTYCVSFPYLKS